MEQLPRIVDVSLNIEMTNGHEYEISVSPLMFEAIVSATGLVAYMDEKTGKIGFSQFTDKTIKDEVLTRLPKWKADPTSRIEVDSQR